MWSTDKPQRLTFDQPATEVNVSNTDAVLRVLQFNSTGVVDDAVLARVAMHGHWVRTLWYHLWACVDVIAPCTVQCTQVCHRLVRLFVCLLSVCCDAVCCLLLSFSYD